MHGLGAWLGDRLAPACAFMGIKALKKKIKIKDQRSCFPRRRAHVFPLAGLGRGDIRKPCCCWGEQRWPLSHTICMRQWDAIVIAGNGCKQWGCLWPWVAMERVQTGALGSG